MNTTRKSTTKAKTTAQKELADQATTTTQAVALVPIEMIDTRTQVRTEFDEKTIAELARDIEANGILQPVLINKNGDRYVMIAGERRLRAARLANMTHIRAVIGEIDEQQARRIQLAENIQREDLSLRDLSMAVRQLYEELGNLTAVADACHKSKAWACKQLSLTEPDLSFTARQLLESEACEDIETIKAINDLCAIDWRKGQFLANEIREGKAGRKEARNALKEAKAALKNKDTPTKTKNKKDDEAKPEERTTADTPQKAIARELWTAIHSDVEKAQKMRDEIEPDTLAEILRPAKTMYERITQLKEEHNPIYIANWVQDSLHGWEYIGAMHALTKPEWNVNTLLSQYAEIHETLNLLDAKLTT